MDQTLQAAVSERCRTVVEIYAGQYVTHDVILPLVCAGVAELDSMFSVWDRARIALQPGALRPAGPYVRTKTATVLILQSDIEERTCFREARLDLILVKGEAYTSVVMQNSAPLDAPPIRVGRTADIVTVVRAVLRSF
jgi:hypothetical protein